jgi:hypothetical protein
MHRALIIPIYSSTSVTCITGYWICWISAGYTDISPEDLFSRIILTIFIKYNIIIVTIIDVGLSCNAVCSCRLLPAFRTNILPPSSEQFHTAFQPRKLTSTPTPPHSQTQIVKWAYMYFAYTSLVFVFVHWRYKFLLGSKSHYGYCSLGKSVRLRSVRSKRQVDQSGGRGSR